MTEATTLERPATEVVTRHSTEVAAQPLTIEQTIRAQYAAIEPTITALAERYRGVAIDVSTPKGLKEAKEARHDLRENGRYFLSRALDAKKSELNEGKAILTEETARLTALLLPTETSIDEQITAREKVLADEKAERERVAAERKAKFEAAIATIRAAAERCKGITAERIANGIRMVEDMAFGEDWAEFAKAAATAQAETLTVMRRLHQEAVDAERAAAEAETRRLEQERAAAELRVESERLKAAQAELARQREELDRQREAIAAEAKAREEAAANTQRDADARAREAQAQCEREAATQADEEDRLAQRGRYAPQIEQLNDDALEAMPSIADQVARVEPPAAAAAPRSLDLDEVAGRPWVAAWSTVRSTEAVMATTGPLTFADAPPAAADEPPMALGAICDWLGFTVTAAFMAKLGLTPLESKGRAVLFPASVRPALKDALIAHIEGLQ